MHRATPEGKLLDLIKKAQGRFKLKKELKIFTKINILLIILIVAVFAIFLIDVISSKKDMGSAGLDLLESKIEIPQEPAETEEYAGDDIVFIPKEEKQEPAVSKGDIAKGLNLLGIVAGNDAQAIIEDTEKNKTFFLYKGDSFGEFVVYDIKDSAVVLDYKGEKFELSI